MLNLRGEWIRLCIILFPRDLGFREYNRNSTIMRFKKISFPKPNVLESNSGSPRVFGIKGVLGAIESGVRV